MNVYVENIYRKYILKYMYMYSEYIYWICIKIIDIDIFCLGFIDFLGFVDW